MPEAFEPIILERGSTSRTGRSLAVFLVSSLVGMVAFLPKMDGVGVLLAFAIALAVTEIFARRFPCGVDLRWLFRPNVLALAEAAGLFLASLVFLKNFAAICIEGGFVVGFPYYFFVQCYGPGGIPDPSQFLIPGLALDLVIWYFFGTFLASFVRPRKPVLVVLA